MKVARAVPSSPSVTVTSLTENPVGRVPCTARVTEPRYDESHIGGGENDLRAFARSGLELLDYADAVKFIIITGSPREESLNEAFDHGAVAYLVKPFTLQDVLDAIALAGETG